MRERRWIAIGAVAAVLYLVVSQLALPLPLRVAVKAAAVAPLVVAALAAARPWSRRLAGGLVCHLAGDVLIETAPLPAAMAAFLAGHLLYLSLFLPWRSRWERLGWERRLLAVVLVADAVAFGAVVVPRAGELSVAVAVYAAGLLAMALSATVAAAPIALAAGAALYVLSDSLLGMHLFVAPLPLENWLTWPSYWSGQALITYGALRRRPTAPEGGAP